MKATSNKLIKILIMRYSVPYLFDIHQISNFTFKMLIDTISFNLQQLGTNHRLRGIKKKSFPRFSNRSTKTIL